MFIIFAFKCDRTPLTHFTVHFVYSWVWVGHHHIQWGKQVIVVVVVYDIVRISNRAFEPQFAITSPDGELAK